MSELKSLDSKLSVTEELDFHYLLTLMPVLESIPLFSWLPELFSIIGHEKLIRLCKYAGGETIQIPTLEELSEAVESIQWYHDVYIKGTQDESKIPSKYKNLVSRISGVINA